MFKPHVELGDCLEGLLRIDENTADLALIDPPYFDYKTSHRKDKTDKLSQSFHQQTKEEQLAVIHQCIRVLKPDRAFYLFTNWENIWWMQERFEGIFRNMIVWDKGNWTAGDLRGSFGSQYEIIFLGCKGKWEYKGKRESDIWRVSRVGTNRIHPTEKPVDLYKKIILSSTNEGGFIIDPYLGSGASVIAAMETNRLILGWEIDQEYHSRIMRRVDEYRKGLPVPNSNERPESVQ